MHTHDKPASFHGSPHEAMQAPPEEFLYLGTTERLTRLVFAPRRWGT
jgi:hypothetical protein